MVAIEWNQRRSRLNHNDLQGTFIGALDGQASFLKKGVEDASIQEAEDPTKIRTFLHDQFQQWTSLHADLSELLGQFHREMSPRSLFGQLLLSRCDERTKAWLPAVVHELWRIRYPVDGLIADARTKLAAADAIWQELKAKIESTAGVEKFEVFMQFRDNIESLAAACRALGQAIHLLPHRVLVT
jgi:hypothetical protein